MERSQDIHTCLVCHNIDCESRGSVPIGEEITRLLAEANSSVKMMPHLCFGACEEGPNIVVYPQGTWYKGCQLSDAEDIAAHCMGGPEVERLTADVDPALRDLILMILDAGLVDF